MTTWHTRYGTEVPESRVTPLSEERGEFLDDAQPCTRCGGAGGFQHWPGYTCYRCGGGGYEERKYVKVYTAEKNARLDAALAAARDAFVAAHGDIIDMAHEHASKNDFLDSVIRSVEEKWTMTDRQEEAIRSCVEQIELREAEEAKAADFPAGRMVVTGTVLGMKEVLNEWGGNLKMLVKDDRGFKVWSTVPSGLFKYDWTVDECHGMRVQFTATLEPSGDDPKFGFGSRPAKATVLENK